MEVDRALQPVAVWTQDSSSGLTRAPGYSTLVFAGRLHRSQTRYWASWSHLSKRDATLWGWKASSPIGTTCIWGYGVCWFSLLYFFYPSKVRHLLGTFFFFCALVQGLWVFQSSSLPLADFQCLLIVTHLKMQASVCSFGSRWRRRCMLSLSGLLGSLSFCAFSLGARTGVWLALNFGGIVMWVRQTDHELSHIRRQENTVFLHHR